MIMGSAYTYQNSKQYVIRVLSENSSLKPFFIACPKVCSKPYILQNRYFMKLLPLNLRQEF